MRDHFEELMRQLSPEMAAKQRAAQAKAQATETERLMEAAKLFQLTGTVHGVSRTPQGNMDPDSVFTIRKWQNQEGDIIYSKHKQTQQKDDPSQNEMLALSAQIKTQQADFNRMNLSEQSRIMTNSSEGNIDNRFGDYLANQALASLFQKLK